MMNSKYRPSPRWIWKLTFFQVLLWNVQESRAWSNFVWIFSNLEIFSLRHHLWLSPYHYKLQWNNISDLSLLLHAEWPSRTMNRWWGDVATLNEWSGVARNNRPTTWPLLRLDREILVKAKTICPPQYNSKYWWVRKLILSIYLQLAYMQWFSYMQFVPEDCMIWLKNISELNLGGICSSSQR